jgi:hypothetical protein
LRWCCYRQALPEPSDIGSTFDSLDPKQFVCCNRRLAIALVLFDKHRRLARAYVVVLSTVVVIETVWTTLERPVQDGTPQRGD